MYERIFIYSINRPPYGGDNMYISPVPLGLIMKHAPTLGDIDHTPPSGESVSNVWNR